MSEFIRRRHLRDQLGEAIRDRIVHQRLPANQSIGEHALASELGVSRTPVREALQRLQQEGYVMGSPGAQQSRLTVTPLTQADVHELLDIVGALEGLGARRAATADGPTRRTLAKELRALNQDFAKAARSPVDHGRLYEADERLHRRIVEAGVGPGGLAALLEVGVRLAQQPPDRVAEGVLLVVVGEVHVVLLRVPGSCG
jgi:DNA-binding GntR family transcriptional regulator